MSYQKPQDCSIITEQNRHNPFAYLFRDQCERINASTRQSTARAEWEYAARGGTRTATWLGNISWHEPTIGCSGSEPNLEPIAWYCWNSGKRVQPGKQKWPNPWGLYDMLGNVSELTSTTKSYAGYGSGPQVDPVGYWYDTLGREERNLFPYALQEGAFRRQDKPVMRGGNSSFDSSAVTNEIRTNFGGAQRGVSVLGFRMARTLLE